jgi:hypothetical protein
VKCACIYYRIDPALTNLAAARIDALLDVMAAHCSQPPRRLTRCDDAATWMEVYEDIADLAMFSAILTATVRTLDCTAFTEGERHLECFSAPDPAP